MLEQLSIATDIQFHVFNFQICLPWLFTKKELIVHIQHYVYLELMVALWLVSS